MSHPFILTAPEGLPYVDIERTFDAPAAKLWRARTEPDLVAQWIGRKIVEWDFTPGGRFGYEHVFEGETLSFWGHFHNIREDDFYVAQTFEFEKNPDKPTLEFSWLDVLAPNQCRLRGHAVYFDMPARDAMVKGPVDFSEGVIEGYSKLDALLETL